MVWLGSPLPRRVEMLRADISRHDPDVTVLVWRDDDLRWLRNHDLLVRESLFAAKADIARYEILERHGGLYLDADFRVHGSLARVFDDIDRHGVVVARQSRAVYTNAFLGAVPSHPLLIDLVQGLPDSIRWTGRMTEPATTGPHFLTARLLHHLRRGGTALEMPQRAVFPWSTDEEPIPSAALPGSVVASHDWSSLRGWSWHGAGVEPVSVPVPDRASRRRRTGRRPRTRAAATPLVHSAVAAGEARLLAPAHRASRASADLRGIGPTRAAVERWTARSIVRWLRGSALFLDLNPASTLPLLTASRVLDRPGTAIAVLGGDRAARLPSDWKDPSIRCSMHVVRCDDRAPDQIISVQSHGSALLPRPVTRDLPPIGATLSGETLDVAGLLESLPRCDLVRADADHLSRPVADVLRRSTARRRIGRLILVIDPLSPAAGVAEAVRLLSGLEEDGLPVGLGPWLLDGRGRTWWAHLRVAARPFVVSVG